MKRALGVGADACADHGSEGFEHSPI